ncbi:MAG: RagB/SusD family nutrient uptake outer membrane protein [Bacteroidetes bacterium]|nr:RagB/SusD family nutrient uptake outer membrane protein [Bacteroidota bacterium]MBU1115567.1 RagB/SusD family nutrient uptake outer membrane protein [Bacteroidota bacterium]MBU1798611.1 RagB/SusD family nutrient uptake outer membrane protein [Bacteroidota bacterium]
MKKFNISTFFLIVIIASIVTSCDLNISNPNTPTEADVLSTAQGLKAVAIGMQGRMAIGVDDQVLIPGLLAGEFSANSNSMANDREFQDQMIIEDNASVRLLWSHSYQAIKSANDILHNIDAVQFSDGTKNGMVALAKTAKVIEFTTLLQCGFQQLPVETYNSNTPSFVSKTEAINYCLTLLSEAATPAANVSDEFTNDILGDGFDLLNTIKVFQARLSLMKEDYSAAITFANSVDAGATSVFVYSAINLNPMTDNFHTRHMFGATANWRDNAESGDTRVEALFDTTSYNSGLTWTNPDENKLYDVLLWKNQLSSFELFRYGEMTLIKAEAYARTNDLSNAATQINIIRSAAGLANFNSNDQSAVLQEILKQRQYELYATGVSLEDLRRFGKISLAKVAWLPYPQVERESNPSTPSNP